MIPKKSEAKNRISAADRQPVPINFPESNSGLEN